MTHRKLSLRAEHLVELAPSDLGVVAAGASQPGNTCNCPDYTYYCITGPAMCRDSRIICS